MPLKKIINNLAYCLIFLSFIFYIFSSLYHPLISDDIWLQYSIIESDSFYNYFISKYFNWTGRFLQIILSYLIFTNDIILLILKIFTIPLFFLSIWIAWFCITGHYISYNQNSFWKFICFASLIWMATPAISENVIWATGFITWLYPLFFSMLFLNFYFKFYYSYENQNLQNNKNFTWKLIPLILLGFISGSSIEQLSSIIFILITFVIFKILLLKKCKVTTEFYLGYISLILGILFLISAPGNYERLNLVNDAIFIKIFKYLLYLSSAYYSLGAENVGKSFIFSLIIIIFVFNQNTSFFQLSIKKSFIWLSASLVSLIVMLPVTSFLSLRTTFFPIIFFYFFWLSLNYNKNQEVEKDEFIKKTLVLFFISSLLFFDSFTAFLSNKSLSKEVENRNQLIQMAEKNSLKKITVPFYSTIPSRLTHMENPYQDRIFLEHLSIKKRIQIVHEFDNKSDLPYSKNTLKEFKNILN